MARGCVLPIIEDMRDFLRKSELWRGLEFVLGRTHSDEIVQGVVRLFRGINIII